MSRLYTLLTICVLLGLPVGPAWGLSLSLQPTESTIVLGDTIDIAINIDGLVASTPPPFFAFGVEITFDRSILQFNAVTFGPSFGNPLDDSETLISFGFFQSKLQIFIDSRLSEDELFPLQPENFSLATLTFTGNRVGGSSLGILGGPVDRQGNQAGLFGTPASISVKPTGSGPVIPEPSTILLLATGHLMMYQWHQHEPSTHW